MATLDNTMATCPLKHEIRTALWDKYVSKIKKEHKKYLTLFSPPLMDVKYLQRKGHIEINDYRYNDVVGVYLQDKKDENYTKIISEGKARIGSLIEGDINDINKINREIKPHFPFDVINLDYCNYITAGTYSPYVSEHLNAIEEFIKFQSLNGQQDFILFVTSRIDPTTSKNKGFDKEFLDHLLSIIDDNIKTYSVWENGYKKAFDNLTLKQFRNALTQDFITIGLTKLLAHPLSRYEYKIHDADAYRLIRDKKNPPIDLLHLAFHLKLVKSSKQKIQGYTQSRNYEKESKVILNKYIDHKVIILSEKVDEKRLKQIHGEIITDLNKENFEHPVPDPI